MSILAANPLHSAVVHITLHTGGHEWGVAQMGPDFIILRDASAKDIPPGPALITLTVDGAAEEIHVHLPAGIPAGNRRAAIAEATAVMAAARAQWGSIPFLMMFFIGFAYVAGGSVLKRLNLSAVSSSDADGEPPALAVN